ncbi:DUF4157 domain-containing protein [Streptomyces sp. NPDC001985]|uniref:eCIS core domain-containing protein n=1 Tax=Streptomyces sp. NPDC001985 TaxID=3154406 RepID=UPI00332F3CBF
MTPERAATLQRTIGNAAVARMVEAEAQREAGAGGEAPGPESRRPVQRATVHAVLRSPGRALDDSVRTDMEARLGADFSDVRVHDDSAARASAAEVGARAYTSGNHVVIGAGGADPHTLAHELTHVVQQRQGPVAGTDTGDGLRISDPSDRFEREAEAGARRAMAAPSRSAAGGGRSGESGRSGHGHEHGPGRGGHGAGAAVQRMPPKRKKEEVASGNSPPPQRRNTRGSSKNFDLNKPRLVFTSQYDGPASQRLNANQSIGFTQAASLRNPDGAPLSVATNYHFWQQVTDRSVQITPDNPAPGQETFRDWVQDGPYRPLYNNAVIDNSKDRITFNDDPGFSTDRSMTQGYWLASYSVSFRWKVARNTGAFNAGAAAWTSPVVTHTLTSTFDPENPDAPAPITANAADEHSWDIDLSTVDGGQ